MRLIIGEMQEQIRSNTYERLKKKREQPITQWDRVENRGWRFVGFTRTNWKIGAGCRASFYNVYNVRVTYEAQDCKTAFDTTCSQSPDRSQFFPRAT